MRLKHVTQKHLENSNPKNPKMSPKGSPKEVRVLAVEVPGPPLDASWVLLGASWVPKDASRPQNDLQIDPNLSKKITQMELKNPIDLLSKLFYSLTVDKKLCNILRNEFAQHFTKKQNCIIQAMLNVFKLLTNEITLVVQDHV